MIEKAGAALETSGKVSTLALVAKEGADRIFDFPIPSLPELAVLLPIVVSALWAVKLSLDIGFTLYDRWKGKTAQS
ncbi:hypothetical protein 13AC503A_gene0050 [Aeromonas phage 13AC503A]|nr:hypothetical protein 13AC503A_gene0050 [Aeromonas phage 13AC503A]